MRHPARPRRFGGPHHALIAVLAVVLTWSADHVNASPDEPVPRRSIVAGPVVGVGQPAAIPDAELVIALDNPAEQLRGAAGVALRRFLTESGAFGRTAEAWNGLSRALGLDPDAAISRLMGGRVMLLANDLGGNTLAWALVLSVDDPTGRLVTRRLKGSPRDAISGHTVYSIEDGLVRVAHLRPATAKKSEPGPTVLVVAPRGDESVLRSGVALGTAWLNDDPHAHAGRAKNGVVVYRPPGGGALSGRIKSFNKGWVVQFEGTGFDRPGDGAASVAGARVRAPAVRFESIARESLLAYAGPASGPGDPTSALGILAPERLVWMLLPFDAPSAFLGHENRPAVLSLADAGGGRLDCTMWFGISSIPRAAREGDDYVCRVLGDLTDQYGPGKNAPECTGQAPAAARSIQVLLDPERSSFGPALSFAWGPACEGNAPSCGWWGMRVAAMDGLPGAARPPVLPVADIPDAPGVQLLARPAGLASLLGAQSGLATGLLKPLRWIDTIRWELDRPGPPGLIRGSLTLRMNTDP